MIKIEAYKQVTKSYHAGWSGLNETAHLGFSVKCVFGSTRYSRDGETRATWVYMTTSKPVSIDAVAMMLHEFDKGCRCEHDCCGHWNGGAYYSTLKKISRNGRQFAVNVSYSMNV